MVDAKPRGGNICLYCGKDNCGKVDEEGVCGKCENINDEELRDYTECYFCGNETRNGNLRALKGDMGCPNCVGVCDGCGNNYDRDDEKECRHCGNLFCSGCMGSCNDCRDDVCTQCKIECNKCGDAICPECSYVHKGKEICNDCYDEVKEKEEKQSTLKACT